MGTIWLQKKKLLTEPQTGATISIGGVPMDKIEILREWVKESHNIVAFTGAGVSTESGVKDFRSKDGLYSETWRPNDGISTEIRR